MHPTPCASGAEPVVFLWLRTRPGVIGLATVLVALTCWLAADSAPATAHSFTVVMKELDNPRGLAFGDDGALYVAEAGSGGADLASACAVCPPCALAAPGR